VIFKYLGELTLGDQGCCPNIGFGKASSIAFSYKVENAMEELLFANLYSHCLDNQSVKEL